MTTSRARQRIGRASLVVAAFAAGCSHDPEVERRGGPLPDAGMTPTPPDCAPDSGVGGEGGALSVTVTFCQAERVLRESCQRCHGDPTENGAPFSLVTYEDTQEPYGVDKARWQRMYEVVESDFMPLRGNFDPPVEPLSCEQKKTLLGWLAQCARPEGGTSCEGPDEELVACD
jgi:hypothetical protein